MAPDPWRAVPTGKLAEETVTYSKLNQGVRERIAAVTTPAAPVAMPQSVKYAETAGKAQTAAVRTPPPKPNPLTTRPTPTTPTPSAASRPATT